MMYTATVTVCSEFCTNHSKQSEHHVEDLHLATLKAVSFYLLHNVSTLIQCRKLSCGTVVCKHFASYQGYPNYRWDLIWYAKG
jgi:hypothetical protein